MAAMDNAFHVLVFIYNFADNNITNIVLTVTYNHKYKKNFTTKYTHTVYNATTQCTPLKHSEHYNYYTMYCTVHCYFTVYPAIAQYTLLLHSEPCYRTGYTAITRSTLLFQSLQYSVCDYKKHTAISQCALLFHNVL